MAPGMRSSLIALALCLTAGTALAAGPASTWSDPPARKAEGDRPAATVPDSTPKPAPTPGVASRTKGTEPPAGMAMSRRQRIAARPKRHKAHVAARPAPRRQPVIAARHPAPILASRRPFVAGSYPAYRAVDFPHDYEDERLERLGTAVRSGYLAMGRRSVVYPDGRVIHVYRPIDAGEDD
jgi:hypothetical protein